MNPAALRLLTLLPVLGFGLSTPGFAAVAYLLVQGEFDGGNPGLETSRWQVNHTGTGVLTGQDLLDAVFGSPELVSGTHYKTDPTLWAADGSTWEVDYTLYAGAGFFVNSFLRNGVALIPDFLEGLGWNYFAAGGSYYNSFDDTSGTYASGAWASSITGAGDRDLANGSFDAWVFGNDGYGATPQAAVSAPFNPPSPVTFTVAPLNVVNLGTVPEPRPALLLVGGLSAIALRRRRRAGATRHRKGP